MISTQNMDPGMLPLLQLLGGRVAPQELEGLDSLAGLEGGGGERFLDVLEPQLEALLSELGVSAEELQGLDLQGMLERLRGVFAHTGLAGADGPGGNALPLTGLLAAGAEPKGSLPATRGAGDIDSGLRQADPHGAERFTSVQPLPATLMRLFVEAGQFGTGPADASGLKAELPGGSGALSRENVLEVLAQWIARGSGTTDRSGSEVPGTSVPAANGGQTEAGEAVRSPVVVDMTRLLQASNGARELADQVRLLALAQGGGRTELKLHPPQLGTLDVRVSVEGDRASVQFISANPVTREVLEAAMPRLRESLAEGGLLLDDATVSDQASEEHAQRGGEQTPGDRASAGDDKPVDAGKQAEDGNDSTLSMLNRRLDLFA